jgi:hypothetical protein
LSGAPSFEYDSSSFRSIFLKSGTICIMHVFGNPWYCIYHFCVIHDFYKCLFNDEEINTIFTEWNNLSLDWMNESSKHINWISKQFWMTWGKATDS